MAPEVALAQSQRFRQHTIDLIEQMLPHQGDERKLIAVAKQGRQQLEQMWAQERASGVPDAGAGPAAAGSSSGTA